jgi:prepilin peptidase CpaA
MDDVTVILPQAATLSTSGLLAYAGLHDLAFRTVPNSVSIAIVACGVAAHLMTGDLVRAILTSLAVFALVFLAWYAKTLGGGDAKLLASTAFAIPAAAVFTLLFATALAGGVLAFGFLALRPILPATSPSRPPRLTRRILRAEVWRIRRRGPLPYAVAISAGGAYALLAG